MDEVIERLTEIEQTAKEIVAHADQERKALKSKMLKQQQELESSIQADTGKRIQEIRDNLEQSKKEALAKLEQQTKCVLDTLEKEFHDNHSLYAKEIFRYMAEVE